MNVDPRLNEIKDCLYRVATKVIIAHEGKLLVVLEKDDDWWNLPGGGVDHGEEIDQAIVRELQEEVGLESTDIMAIDKPVFVATNASMDGVPRTNIFYTANVRIDALRAGRDVAELRRVTPEEFNALKISPAIASYKEKILAELR